MTTNPEEPARPTPNTACTVMDFASRLGISRRAALDRFVAAANHLNVVIQTEDSGRLTVTATDFARMIKLVELVNSVGLTIRQLHRIQQCQDPNVWALLQGPRAEVTAPVTDHHQARADEALLRRIEAMFAELTDQLARQDGLRRQELSRPDPGLDVPAPVPVPARVEEPQVPVLSQQTGAPPEQFHPPVVPTPVPVLSVPRQVEFAQVVDPQPDLLPRPLPVPVPVPASIRGRTDWTERSPNPAPAPAKRPVEFPED